MMNKQRGAYTVTIQGQTYTLYYTFNSLALLEEKKGVTAPELAKLIGSGKMGFRDMILFFWAGIVRNHPHITIEEAGELLTEAAEEGCLQAVLKQMVEALTALFQKLQVTPGNVEKGQG